MRVDVQFHDTIIEDQMYTRFLQQFFVSLPSHVLHKATYQRQVCNDVRRGEGSGEQTILDGHLGRPMSDAFAAVAAFCFPFVCSFYWIMTP